MGKKKTISTSCRRRVFIIGFSEALGDAINRLWKLTFHLRINVEGPNQPMEFSLLYSDLFISSFLNCCIAKVKRGRRCQIGRGFSGYQMRKMRDFRDEDDGSEGLEDRDFLLLPSQF